MYEDIFPEKRLPYTIAFPVSQAMAKLKSGLFGAAMNHLLDFFEISVQYASCLIFCMLKKHPGSVPAARALTNVVSKIDNKRPLSFGDWVNDIFMPLHKAAMETEPEHPLVKAIGGHVLQKRKNILLGRKGNPSIVQIRNEYKGHSTTLSEEIYKDILILLEDRVRSMLAGLSPLGEYEFLAIDNDGRPWSMNGTDPAPLDSDDSTPGSAERVFSELEKSHYYAYCKERDSSPMDLYPLVFFNERHYVYVFQSLKDENTSYISANENAVTFIGDTMNDSIDKAFQTVLPSFDIARELNWNEIKKYMTAESGQFISKKYKEKKYNQELFVDRQRLTRTLHLFLESSDTLFPLLGEAGQGKTSQLCFWTEKLIEEDEAVLIFNSTEFAGCPLEEKINGIFGYNARRDVSRILDRIHGKAAENGKLVYFFFDAINECLSYRGRTDAADPEGKPDLPDIRNDGPLQLFMAMKRLLIKEKYPRFKVIFTCRFYTWKNLLQKYAGSDNSLTFNAGNEDELAIRGFTPDETREAYNIYRRLYQMKTPFGDIDKRVLIRLRDPLIMKFVSSNYLGAELTDDTEKYTSVALFEKMLADIGNSYAGELQCRIISGIADFLLSKYLEGIPSDSISSEELANARKDIGSPLHELAGLIYKKDGITIAFAELLNRAEHPVLMEAEKPNGDKEGTEIRFIYERFLEFVLAKAFLRRISDETADASEPVPAEKYAETLEKAVDNVVFMGAMRNALVIDCLRTGNFSSIISLAERESDNWSVMQLVTEVMNLFIRENYETELFSLMDKLLTTKITDGGSAVARFNAVNKKIQANMADMETIAEYRLLSEKLAPIMRLRRLAALSTVNGILLTDWFNDGLYRRDALDFLWDLMCDDIHDVRNEACMYTYYLSNRKHTLEYTPLKENLCQRIICTMYDRICSRPLPVTVASRKIRTRAFVFLETATRLGTLQVIDGLIGKKRDEYTVRKMLGEIERTVRYLTWDFRLIRAFMPFLQPVMRKQITFQSSYVNNAIEYQSFWDDNVIAPGHQEGKWTRECLKDMMKFVFHHAKYHDDRESAECIREEEEFRTYRSNIISAYSTGDSFSYFALERLLIIMGTTRWENIRQCVTDFFSTGAKESEWTDYSRMSMLYVLFQTELYSSGENRELLDIFTRECEAWTRECRGRFRARNSRKANPTGYYKRNVMTWYAAGYCCRPGDGCARAGDSRCVPLFYSMLDSAAEENDKELLFHLIDNISELITDFGYIRTALNLIRHIMTIYGSAEKVRATDEMAVDRDGIYGYDLIKLIGNVLGTAKNYFPAEIDSFLKKEITDLSFPGIPAYREEILNYNPSGETLSDLFTHKFGKFLTWALLYEKSVDNFAYECMCASTDAPDCFAWFNQVVRTLMRQMFKVKV